METNQRFKCLLCSDLAVFDNHSANLHTDHPKQPLVSDEALLSKFGTKADEPEFHEISVFNCPYCDRQRLSISTLYDHLTLEHLDVPFAVRCPVCVCFRNDVSIVDGVHLAKHLAEQHSSTPEQYQEHVLIYDLYGDDERELLRFIASTLPPTYCEDLSRRSSSKVKVNDRSTAGRSNEATTLGRLCSICLDMVFETSCRELSCKHKFHRECIDLWTAQNATCPVCRTSVGVQN